MYKPVEAFATIQLDQVNRLIAWQPRSSRQQVASCGRYSKMRTALKTTKHTATTAPAAIKVSGSPASTHVEILLNASKVPTRRALLNRAGRAGSHSRQG